LELAEKDKELAEMRAEIGELQSSKDKESISTMNLD